MLHTVRTRLCLSGPVHDVFADPQRNTALREGEGGPALVTSARLAVGGPEMPSYPSMLRIAFIHFHSKNDEES